MRTYVKISKVKSDHNHVLTEYGKSKTKPNMSFTVKELVNMNKKGIGPDVLKRALWEMEDLGEELNPLRAKNLDLTDVDRVIAEVKQFQDKIEAENKKKVLQAKEDEKRKIIEEYQKEVDKNKDGIHDLKTVTSDESKSE